MKKYWVIGIGLLLLLCALLLRNATINPQSPPPSIPKPKPQMAESSGSSGQQDLSPISKLEEQGLKKPARSLVQGGSQGGVVVNEEQQPVANATVFLAHKLQPTPRGQKTTTGPHGRFNFGSLPPGEYAPSVQAKGYVVEAVMPDPIKVTSGVRNADVTFRVRRGWTISGIVIDEHQKPVAKAKITIKEGTRSAWDVSKEDGTFQVTGIIPDDPEQQAETGIDSLMCRADGFPMLRLRNISPGSDLKLVLSRPGVLTVSIQLSDRPVAPDLPWSIWLLGEQEIDERSGAAIRRTWQVKYYEGETGIRDRLNPGLYKLIVRAGGREPYHIPRIQIHPGQTTRIDATLVPGSGGGLGGVRLKLNSKEELRRQLDKLLKGLSPTERTSLLDVLRSQASSYPRESPKRQMIVETLKILGYEMPPGE